MKNGARQFSAFVEPHGIYLVEYRRERDGISILHQHSDPRRVIGLADAGERLATAIQSGGAVSGHLSVALRGFGSTYQIMLLPPAEPAVLGPVVRRELARLNPDMENPRVDYVLHGEGDRRQSVRPDAGRALQEVLVGAAPATALSAFGKELSAAGIELDHLTVLPQVIQRLYQQADSSPAPTACYVELPGGPVIAFFYEGQLRLVVEPPFSAAAEVPSRTQTLIEHLDRGNLYLRQQFRGVELSRLLIAADPAEEDALLEALRQQLGYPVEKFPGPAGATGALVSMGAVLDGEAEKGLNLSPFAESPEAVKERRQRHNALLAAGVVVSLAIIWAVLSLTSALKWSRQVQTLSKVAESRIATLAPIRVIAAERQKNAQSVAYLGKVETDRLRAQAVLRAIVRATPPGVQLLSISLDKSGDEWSASIAGAAFGESGADVLLGIDRFFHSLPRELPMHDLVLAELDDVAGGEFGAGMKFKLTFVSPGARP